MQIEVKVLGQAFRPVADGVVVQVEAFRHCGDISVGSQVSPQGVQIVGLPSGMVGLDLGISIYNYLNEFADMELKPNYATDQLGARA